MIHYNLKLNILNFVAIFDSFVCKLFKISNVLGQNMKYVVHSTKKTNFINFRIFNYKTIVQFHIHIYHKNH